MGAPVILDHRGNPVSVAAISTHFEGASIEVRLGEWGLSGAGPNASLHGSLVSLRRRARTLCNNNPLAKGGLDSFVANLVGTDISPTWELDNGEQKEELQQLWADSQQELDFYGVSDFYGQQELAARAMMQDGEVLCRFQEAHPGDGLTVPLQLQLLEADHLEVDYNDVSPEGNEIRYGIEWKGGRRYRYWLTADHPGEVFCRTELGLTCCRRSSLYNSMSSRVGFRRLVFPYRSINSFSVSRSLAMVCLDCF